MTFSRKVSCPYCGAVDRVPAERWSDELECSACGRALFATKPEDLDGAVFREWLEDGGLPLLVDFWAPWCGPCKAMAPAFEQAARSLESKVRFAKLNTDEEQAVAGEFNIRSIPTMILFRDGAEVARHSGAMGAADIERWLAEQLAPEAA